MDLVAIEDETGDDGGSGEVAAESDEGDEHEDQEGIDVDGDIPGDDAADDDEEQAEHEVERAKRSLELILVPGAGGYLQSGILLMRRLYHRDALKALPRWWNAGAEEPSLFGDGFEARTRPRSGLELFILTKLL